MWVAEHSAYRSSLLYDLIKNLLPSIFIHPSDWGVFIRTYVNAFRRTHFNASRRHDVCRRCTKRHSPNHHIDYSQTCFNRKISSSRRSTECLVQYVSFLLFEFSTSKLVQILQRRRNRQWGCAIKLYIHVNMKWLSFPNSYFESWNRAQIFFCLKRRISQSMSTFRDCQEFFAHSPPFVSFLLSHGSSLEPKATLTNSCLSS